MAGHRRAHRFAVLTRSLGAALCAVLAACMNWDPEAPEANPHPGHFVTLSVTGLSIQKARFFAEYETDVHRCKHMVRTGGAGSYYLLDPGPIAKDVPIALLPAGNDVAKGVFATDQFLPGVCGWRFKRVASAYAEDSPQSDDDLESPFQLSSIALLEPRVDPGGDPEGPLDLWCYRVLYEQKLHRGCAALVMLRHSNAPGEVSARFLSSVPAAQRNDRGIRVMTPKTAEISVTLHSLNAIPGALISDDERAAQVAQLTGENAAPPQIPETGLSVSADAKDAARSADWRVSGTFQIGWDVYVTLYSVPDIVRLPDGSVHVRTEDSLITPADVDKAMGGDKAFLAIVDGRIRAHYIPPVDAVEKLDGYQVMHTIVLEEMADEQKVYPTWVHLTEIDCKAQKLRDLQMTTYVKGTKTRSSNRAGNWIYLENYQPHISASNLVALVCDAQQTAPDNSPASPDR